MNVYRGRDAGSGVVAYENGDGFIVIEFVGRESHPNRFYRYTDESCGAGAVALMQRLAEEGRGLSTFVARHGPAYASRWP